jgi:hypothetical protein
MKKRNLKKETTTKKPHKESIKQKAGYLKK